jgi:lipopolysaccharide heptosyltransferase II
MLIEAEKTWENAKNILAVRLDSMGDVLMTGPALRTLKESSTGRTITLLTSPQGAQIAALMTEVDDVITYEAPWMKMSSPREDSRSDYVLAAQLGQASFDGAVIFTVYSQNAHPSAFLCFLANIPLRLGYSRENPYQLLTDWVQDLDHQDNGRHEVRRQLDLVGTIGCSTEDERLRLTVSNTAEKSMQRKLETAGIDLNKPWIAVHPGASAPSRRYPPEGFIEVGKILTQKKGLQIVFTGGQPECGLVESIQKEVGEKTVSLAGMLTLEELAALLQLTPLLISNNTGPVHMAAAVGTPVVDIYALTNPQHTPWMTPHRVLNHDVPCKYCYKSVCPQGHQECISKVPPADVVKAAAQLLKAETKPRAV